MLSNRFKASEAQVVAKKANNFIDQVDAIIAKAALDGKTECHINFCAGKVNGYNELGELWYNAHNFFIAHYKSRGFKIEQEGQCNLFITW